MRRLGSRNRKTLVREILAILPAAPLPQDLDYDTLSIIHLNVTTGLPVDWAVISTKEEDMRQAKPTDRLTTKLSRSIFDEGHAQLKALAGGQAVKQRYVDALTKVFYCETVGDANALVARIISSITIQG